MDQSEDSLIAWIRGRVAGGGDPRVALGIGDDMAVVRVGGNDLLVACDMLMDGVDFDARETAPEVIGRKALAVNLSDCAAMAVRPRWALVSVALPDSWSMDQARRLFDGIDELARQFDVALIGGDTNSWDRPLAIDVTILAEPWPGIAPVRRGGARPGDVLVVTGPLGGSRAGHHLSFVPRVREARLLADFLGDGLHAMMDLSDGLSTDAGRMAEASGCGIEFEEAALESAASGAARAQAAADGRTIADHVLNDGEDFELLMAIAPAAWRRVCDGASEGRSEAKREVRAVVQSCLVVGAAVESPASQLLRLHRRDGSRIPIASGGWRHFTGGANRKDE